MVEEHGYTFIGPTPEHIRLMGDKIAAKDAVRELGLSVVPGSDGPVTDDGAAALIAQEIGYPVLVKAASGGGGRGMKVAEAPDELSAVLAHCRNEAAASFGDDAVYIEKYLGKPRHIEIQLLGDGRGKVIHFGERDCSIQRRHQRSSRKRPPPPWTRRRAPKSARGSSMPSPS